MAGGAGGRDRVGAGRRDQAHGNDGSSGTDKDFGQPQWIGYAVSGHICCFPLILAF